MKANNKVHPITITTEDFCTVDIPAMDIVPPLLSEGKGVVKG